MFNRSSLVFLVCLMTLPSMAHAEKKLSLNEVAAAALAVSPALKSARQELRAVEELDEQARANWRPRLDATAGITDENLDNSNFGNADGSTSKDIGLTLDQPLYRGGRSIAQHSEARARITAQRAFMQALEQQVMADAMQAAIDSDAAYRRVQTQIENEKLYADLLAATQARQDSGETTTTDVALAQSRLYGATADLMRARSDHDETLTRLEELTGISGEVWSGIELPKLSLPANVMEGIAAARENNPDQRALAALTAAEEQGVKNIKGELLPQLRFLASWGREWDPSPGLIDEATTRTVGLRLSIPLYEGGATRARARAAAARALARDFDERDLDRATQRGVIDNWRLQRSAAERHQQRLKEAETAMAARTNTLEEIAAGEKTLTDLAQIDQYWLEARLEAVTAAQQSARAMIELARLTGMLTPQALGINPVVN